ncbi:hypothetical protein PIB30_050756 [Stylosanthes scabra]|uniref:Uncharacterized protein n=1 Tax=Stylosanthes scabra TaxID=79078 RepID=A0ABU6TJY5_9FABA|nr:hypothetical protein [Stylosanthes scabra]
MLHPQIFAERHGPGMHVRRMRRQTLQVMLRTLQRCTVSSVGHQLFPPHVPEPRHEVLPHVPNAIRMGCSDRVGLVRNNHETLLGSNVPSQVRQKKRPRLGHLRLNKCKGNRQDIVVPILGHCDQQNPPYFLYKWVPSMEMKFLQCLNASMHRGNDQKALSNCRDPWSSRSPL